MPCERYFSQGFSFTAIERRKEMKLFKCVYKPPWRRNYLIRGDEVGPVELLNRNNKHMLKTDTQLEDGTYYLGGMIITILKEEKTDEDGYTYSFRYGS